MKMARKYMMDARKYEKFQEMMIIYGRKIITMRLMVVFMIIILLCTIGMLIYVFILSFVEPKGLH